MAQYLSPGVYVEEVPSAVQAIAGVGTSTAGFIGTIPDSIKIPEKSTIVNNEEIGTGNGTLTAFDLKKYPVRTTNATFEIRVAGTTTSATLANNDTTKKSTVTFTAAPATGAEIIGDYVGEYEESTFSPVNIGEVKLCTNFGEFKKFFGGYSTDTDQRNLAHAVVGFFGNGGSRCYVVRMKANTDIAKVLEKFEGIDEIAIVAAPGNTNSNVITKIEQHCQIRTKDRFAIYDTPETVESSNNLDLTKLDPSQSGNLVPSFTTYAALYFPWLQVFDPATKKSNATSDGNIFIPPSGHVAGIYARVDTNRGVHKAPANEAISGIVGLKYQIGKAQQDGLNPQGVNAIRDLNGKRLVWGARTLGGAANGEFKYINVRRLFLFLNESIDEGLQWVVFEPNDPGLWQKITRNITAFLTNVWRSGALFGNTPQEAFFVKCDAETNPPDERELGRVVTLVGVAIVRPAEFVIFKLFQKTAE